MRNLARSVLILSAAGLLAACSSSADTATEAPAEPAASTTSAAEEAPTQEAAPSEEPSEEPEAAGSDAVTQMCDLLVAPDAPVPPTIDVNDSGGVETWSEFFLAQADYLDVIYDEAASIADADGSQEAKDSISRIAEANADFVLSIIGLRLSPPTAMTADEVDTTWNLFTSTVEKGCPQWAGAEWPYQGTPTEAIAAEAPVESKTYKGNGDKVIKFEQGPFTAEITNNGSSNFVVYSLDADLDDDDLLVNEIGKYKGTVLATSDDHGGLRIESSGKWTAKVTPIDGLFDDVVSGKVSGTGDAVFVWAIDNNSVVAITHKGDSNFVVYNYTEDGTDLVVNEIGNYKGEQVMDPGIIEINADGKWTLNPS